MAFAQDEEIKETLMKDSHADNGSMYSSRSSTASKPHSSSQSLVMDLPTLKKLLNKTSCEFILNLVLGTATAPG